MNETQREELQAIRTEQRALQTRLASLEQRLARFDAAEAAGAPTQPEAGPVAPVVSTAIPAAAPVVPTALPVVPPPLPPSAPSRPVLAPATAKTASPAVVRPVEPPPLPMEPLGTSPTASGASASAAPTESLEIRIGSTWLVRVGIVILLTGLAFGGNLLYQTVIPHLGPAAKVLLLYLGAGALAGAGAWLERSRQAQDSPKLRNYARVVLAGGLAAVYYVTYAAHYFENLRVIPSPLLAGALLVGWSGFIVWLSDRRASETLATLAILLGFYTSAINESVGAFTLFSNLALSGGAVFLLRRHLWKIFPFASLLASFGSYAFWNYFRFYAEARDLDHLFHQPVAAAPTVFWVAVGFLLVYWLLFTWAAFTSDERVLPALRRAGFVSLNNGAFFALVMWRLYRACPGTFWEGSLLFGGVLLALAETGRRLPRPLDADTENAYLLQGVSLVTLGFLNYFSGWQLGLVLAVQSVTLLAASGRRQSRLLLGASASVAALSFAWTLGQIGSSPVSVPWSSGLGVGAFLVFAAWLAQRALDRPPALSGPNPSGVPVPFLRVLAYAPAYFSFLGLAVWLPLIEQKIPDDSTRALVFAAVAAALTASVYGLRVRAIPFYAQAFLLAAFVHWEVPTVLALWPPATPSAWVTLAVFAATLAVGHWFVRPPGAWWTGGGKERAVARFDAILVVLILYFWVCFWNQSGEPRYDFWTAELAALSLATLIYGLAARYRALAVAGQGLLIASVVCFFGMQSRPRLEGWQEPLLALVPLLTTILIISANYFPRASLVGPTRLAANRLAGLYEGLAVIFFLIWGGEYLPRQSLFAVDCAAGGAVVVLFGLCRERRFITWGGILMLVALIIFGADDSLAERRHWLNLLGVAAMAATQQFARRRSPGEEGAPFVPPAAQAALMSAATLCAWAMVTAWAYVFQPEGGFATVVGWSLFVPVVFAAGWLLHEKVYRWLGLGVLGVSLAHVAVFDIWQLDSLGRTISLFCLGLVILGVGYLYNRFHTKFRRLF